jgi:hypothetical protein
MIGPRIIGMKFDQPLSKPFARRDPDINLCAFWWRKAIGSGIQMGNIL